MLKLGGQDPDQATRGRKQSSREVHPRGLEEVGFSWAKALGQPSMGSVANLLIFSATGSSTWVRSVTATISCQSNN